MKKSFFLIAFLSLSLVMGLNACKGNQSEKKEVEEKVEKIDYSALVAKELPSLDDFIKVVDAFQQGTKQLLPTGKVWDKSEKSIRELLEPMGFTVKRETNRFFISASKNCQFVAKEDNYVYSYSIDSVKTDGLAAAYYFDSMGDMYVKGEILLADTCVYDELLGRIKTAGYELKKNEFAESPDEEQYAKGFYYFLCNRKKNSIALHYDFMEAQGI